MTARSGPVSACPTRREFLRAGGIVAAGMTLGPLLNGCATSGTARAGAGVEEATIVELQAAMQSGRLTSSSLVEIYIERIQAIDRSGPTLRAVQEINPDALAIARALDHLPSEASSAPAYSMYPVCDIDKVRERGETWAVDPETREALDSLGADLRGESQTLAAALRGEMQTLGTELRVEMRALGADLRGEIQKSATELRGEMQTLRTDLRAEIQTSAAETRAYVDGRMEVFAAENRRYFDVVGESLRGEIRGVAELMALSNEQRDRRAEEHEGRTGALEGRVLRLEVRVSGLEESRKPRRTRRR